MRFLGLGISDQVPDEKTIWAFREKLTQEIVIRELFVRFNEEPEKANLISRAGTIVDATFVEAPRQRNSREENATIKEGNIPQEWKKEGNCNKLHQKDTEARWTTKRNELHYGYKNRVKADAEKKENREKSKVRCRIEHLFGFMKNSMSGLAVRSIGLLRASFSIGLSNLIYNLFRYNYLTR